MPFGADTPTPEFVGNSRVRGARSPPGTPRDLTTPSRAHLDPAAGHTDLPADFARAKRRSVARRTSSRESGEAPPARTSPEQSPKAETRRQVCPAGEKTRFSENFFSPPTRKCLSLLFRRSSSAWALSCMHSSSTIREYSNAFVHRAGINTLKLAPFKLHLTRPN